jgi:hypothetical protein
VGLSGKRWADERVLGSCRALSKTWAGPAPAASAEEQAIDTGEWMAMSSCSQVTSQQGQAVWGQVQQLPVTLWGSTSDGVLTL